MKKIIIISIFLSFQIFIFAQSYSGGSGTSGAPYQIANKTDLKYLSEHSGEWSKHFKQTANITFTDADFQSGGDFYNGGAGFIPIGNGTTEFTGTYDGDGKSISNLYILQSSGSGSIGLFGRTNNATLTDISLVDADIEASDYDTDYIGGIAAYIKGTTSISGCTASGDFYGGQYVGALVGYAVSTSSITNCTTSGTVTLNPGSTNVGYCGGLVGQSYASITNSSSSATLVGNKGYTIGGLVGLCASTIEACFATGEVSGRYNIGGLVGSLYSGGSINRCYATGNIVSNAESNGYFLGGLVGKVYCSSGTASISNSYSLGDVTRSYHTYVGFGGFCGKSEQSGSGTITIENCYSIGSVYYTGASDPTDKGFCGVQAGTTTFSYNFFDSEASNQTTGTGAAAKDTDEMTTQSTFTNWNFDDVWQISSGVNDGYPTLQPDSPPVTEYYYRTTANGGAWEVAFGEYTWTRSLTIDGSYENTYIAPTVENSALVTIVDGATVTVASNVEIDQTIVASGASLVINSGCTLTIADGDGTDLTVNGALDMDGGTLTVSSGATLSYGSSSSLIYSDVSSSQTTTTHELPASGCVNVQILNEQGLTLGASTTISGDLYLDWACTFAIGANNFTAEGNTDINGGLTLSTGTYAANGAFDATGGSVIFIGAAALELGGTVSGLGTFTCGTGTTEYKGTADQSVYGSTYHTLAFSGSATKTATDAVIANSLTTSNENFNLILKGGGTTISNAVNFQNTGTLTLGDATSDEFSFEGGISIAETGPSAVSLQGTLQTSNAKATGDIVLRRTTITGDATINSSSNKIDIYDNLVINDGITLTATGGSLDPQNWIYFHGTINSANSGSGNLILNPSFAAKIGENVGSTTPLGTMTVTAGYVEYTSPDITVENLTINGGGYLGGAAPNGNLNIENISIASGGIMDGTSGSFNVSGNWTNNGNYNNNDGTVLFDGAGTSTISGSTGFYNFTCTTAGKSLKFDSDEGKSQTISNNFIITGTSGNPVVISATAVDDAASINVTNANVSYADVSDSQNSGNTIYATNSTDNGNNTGWFFGNEGDYIWAGRTSTDWNTATNWAHNVVPDELTDNVLIPDEDNDPIISSAVGATCNNLTVNAGAVLTINHGGSLITNGTITNNGTINIERSITDDKWHLIASPVSNATAAMFEGNYLQYYDEGWQDITNLTTTLTPAQGYSFWSVAETTSTTFTFTGTPNTGDQSHAITGSTWNLLGNPYPSPIDWAQLDDTYGAVYYWDPVGQNNKSWNNGEGAGVQYVPAMQGFWIKPASSGTFSLSNAKRTHSGSSNYYKNKTTLPYSIELQVDAQNNYYDQLFIVLDENTSEDFDFQYDAWKLFTTSDQVPQLYSFTGTKRLSIDRRPQCDQIPLGFYCGESGQFSIKANEMTDISKLILEDTKLNIFHDLTQGAYTFDWSLNDDETRFKLHCNTTAVENISLPEMQVYVAAGNIIIKSQTTAQRIILTDITGRTLGVWESAESIPAPETSGVYLVTVETDHNRITKKIIIE